MSTVGLVPQLRALARASRCQLAVSLHATTDEVRNWLVPVNRRRAAARDQDLGIKMVLTLPL